MNRKNVRDELEEGDDRADRTRKRVVLSIQEMSDNMYSWRLVLFVSCMLSAMTEAWYISAHIRFEIAAPFGSSLRSRAASLVEDTFTRSTPFKCLSKNSSHCPNASRSDRGDREKQPVDANISVLCPLSYIVLKGRAELAQTLHHKL